MHNITLHVDRIEEDIVVAFADSGTKFSFKKADFDIKESDVIIATFNEKGEAIDIKVSKNETAKIKLSLRERLKKLFNK